MDKSNDADLLPLAILITLIYENRDEKLLNIANKIIAKNAKLSTLNEILNPNKVTVKAIKLKEPFVITELKEGLVKARDLNVRFQLNDIKILDVGEFRTRKEKRCCINFHFEYVKISGTYSINGLISDKKINGEGNAEIILRDVNSEVQIDHSFDVEEEVQITSLDFDFKFKALEFEQSGLEIKDMSPSEVQRMLNSVGKVYFEQNMRAISRQLSESIRDRFNEILKGKNPEQIAELLHRGQMSF